MRKIHKHINYKADTADSATVCLFTFSPEGVTKQPSFKYVDHINEFFKSWERCMSEFEVNPELNLQGNLHYHGYFIIKDKYKWHKKVLPKMKYNGYMKIDKVRDDFNKAIQYSRKDNALMVKMLKDSCIPVPYTHKAKIDIEEKIRLQEIALLNYKPLNDPLDYGLTHFNPEYEDLSIYKYPQRALPPKKGVGGVSGQSVPDDDLNERDAQIDPMAI